MNPRYSPRAPTKGFLDAIRSVNPPGRWKILVVDEHAQKLLGSTLMQYDILEENVTRELPHSFPSPEADPAQSSSPSIASVHLSSSKLCTS